MKSPHLVLWPLAEDFFAEAKRIAPFCTIHGDINFERYYKLVATGLRCLEALLQYQQLQVNIEIRTRFRMADIIFHETNEFQKAEQILSKGIILAQTVSNEALFCIYCKMYVETSRFGNQICNAASSDSYPSEAEEFQLFHWIYIFHFLQFDILSCITYQDVEHSARLSALSKILSISQYRNDYLVYFIASLLEIYIKIETKDYSMAKECLNRLSIIHPTSNDIATLNLIKTIFSIFLNVIQGHGDVAILELKNLHNAFDILAQHDADYSSQDTINLSLDSHNYSRLVINWFNRQQLFVYGHLLAGICHLPDYSSSKAEIFLNEGLEMLKYNLAYNVFLSNNLRTNGNLDWFSVTRELCLIYYCFALMLRSNFSKAFEYIQKLEKYASSFTNNTKALFMLLKGTYAQFIGQLDTALKAYDLIPTSIQEISLLGNLNSVLIFRGDKLHNKKQAYEILNSIKSLCQSSNFTRLEFAWNLVSGSLGDDVLYSKNYLSSVITASEKHANNQFRVIALITMCYYFITHFENEQAEKMLITAYLLSKNAENDLWAFMSGELLEKLMKKKNKRIRAEKQAQLNLKHRERISDIFSCTSARTTDQFL
ncbi:hypothetical protein PCANB_000776 [Pneumocystis canis]|nr:hypothetical protein PCANB_000776 [Pneumocystis canis]